jgi:cytosine/adenosine deaminase-related metal-dependent hydrolase
VQPPEFPVIYAADLVLPVGTPPVERGAVVVDRDGRIAGVGPVEEISRANAGVEVREFRGCTIIPGGINAHAHLGFRRGDEPPGGSFAGWLSVLIERLPEKEAWTEEAARNSAREALETGTTYIAESSPYGECLKPLAESGLAGVVFAEFFPHEIGPPEEAVEYIFNRTRELKRGLPERVSVEVSVHSPYTVDPESSRLAARRSREAGERLAIHLSESPEEVEFVQKGTGGLANIFARNEWGGAGVSPVKYAERIELLGPGTIAAHLATGVSDEDLEILARTGTAAAHCPRSNEYLGCGVSPVPRMLERRIPVGMGTDGLWSSPSMNLFEETLTAVQKHGFGGETGLRLATLGGAEALRMQDEIGSITPGKWADLAVVEAGGGGEPSREVLEAAADGGVVATVVGGRLLYSR